MRFDVMNTSNVIIAIASPPGRSPRGVVRISGDGTLDLLPHMIRTTSGQPLPGTRGLHPARFTLHSVEDDAVFELPVFALLMPGPRSYTGEDAAELQLPGNPVLLDRVLETMIEDGRTRAIDIRRAEAGEFTARAFFNGRLSLTAAEGVSATIAAQSDAELRAAGLLRHGALGRLANTCADKLAAALALVEAGIDFTDEEDVVAITPEELVNRLSSIHNTLQQQLDRAVGMEHLEAIPWVVITGPPNAGKSTLFNALLGRERAVVADVAGTTRDQLAEPLHLPGPHGDAEVMLVDLAGLDEDPNELNQLMQQAARHALNRAELVLHCVPIDDEPPRDVQGELVRTKTDLPTHHDIASTLKVSAISGEGLDALRAFIADRLADRAVGLTGDAMALMPRHESELRAASGSLAEAIELIEPFRNERHLTDPEIIASSMRTALDHLGALAGQITPDDVLGRVFASFCIGK